MTPTPEVLAERERYASIVASMAHADPSALVHEFRGRTRRFSPRDLAVEWRSALEALPAGAAFNLYVHVPYCKSICTFCNYKRLRVSSRESLDEFVDFMTSEARLFAPALRGATFGAMFIGGGTPSVLSADQLDRLIGAVHECFTLHPRAQKNFEYDPMVMTEDRFRVLERYGFTRYSFGIQSLESSVNLLHNRGPQNRRHVARQFELLRRHGASETNVDFLLGLDGTTPIGMVQQIEEVLREQRPEEVSIYFISPTAEYVARHFGGDFARFEAFLKPFEGEVPPAIREAAARLGYLVDGDGNHILILRLKDAPARVRPFHDYCDVPSQIHRPLYVLGLGDSARSRIFGRMLYRAEHDVDDVDEASPRYVGARTTPGDEMFGYVAFVFRDGDTLDRARFRQTFGVDVVDVYAEPIAKLTAVDAITLRDDALLLCPQDRRARLRDILFFMPRERLETIVPRVQEAHAAPRASAAAAPPIAPDEVARLVRPFVALGAIAGGWRLAEIVGTGVAIVRKAPPARVLVRLLAPAGAHPAYRSTARFDVQYEIVDGSPSAAELEPALASLANAVAHNEP